MYDPFPHNFIFWEPVENHQEIKQIYLEKIKQREHLITKPEVWNCDVLSSFECQQINNEIFDEYFHQNVIWKACDKLLQSIPFNFDVPSSSSVLNVWFNTYKKGQYQEIHNHLWSGSNLLILSNERAQNIVGLLSGIYILHSEETNKTVFYQEGMNPFDRTKMGSNFNGTYGIKKTTEEIKEGNVILFPSSLSHYTVPAEKSRTIISFNIVSRYD